jgi:RILP-like protein 1
MSNPLNQPHQIGILISSSIKTFNKKEIYFLKAIKQEELDEFKFVKEENLKFKETIRSKDREINDYKQDLELLRAQVNRMSDSILNFRRKELLSQNQIQKLIQDKSELECKLKEQDHKINELIVIRNRSNSSPINEQEIVAEKEIVNEKPNEPLKKIEDSKDPNRPRYTLHELQELLNEKNELIIKLNQTQEELEAIKKK